MELPPLVEVACVALAKRQPAPCLLCLRLVSVLLESRGPEVVANERLRETLLETLKAEDDEVVESTLQVLVKCVDCGQELQSLLRSIMEVAANADSHADAADGRRVSRGARLPHPPHALQVHEHGDRDVAAGDHHLRVSLPSLHTQNHSDRRFAALFVQMLNVILLTAEEAAEVCKTLRSCFSLTAPKKEGQELFDQL